MGFTYYTASDLLIHAWVNKNQNPGNEVGLSLKELLQISNDSGSVNSIRNSTQAENENLSEDFQQKQVDRIVEAIALTLPPGYSNNLAVALGSMQVSTASTSNLDAISSGQTGTVAQQRNNYRVEMIRELASDMGFDYKVLHKSLLSLF